MINLYSKNETNYTNNGEAALTPVECLFSCAINGVWQLEMTLPYDEEGKHKLVLNNKILKVTGIDSVEEQTAPYQLFRIYDCRREDSTMYVLAFPIALDARHDTYKNVLDLKYKTAAQAILSINNISNKYTVTTDISSDTTKSMAWDNANMISILNGDESFVNTWGGEIVYDNYNIKVNNRLGRASGASEVRYGKNITGMTYEEDISNVITRLYPVANSGEALNAVQAYKRGNNAYVDATNASDYPIPHISYVKTPYNLVQLTNDGSDTYTLSRNFYDVIKDYTADWLYKALTGTETGSNGAWLENFELGWLVDNYGLTMVKDQTQGVVEYLWRKLITTDFPVPAGQIQSLLYNAMKEGFEDVLKNDENAYYIGSSKKQLKSVPFDKYIFTYPWDTGGDYRTTPLDGETYAWVYANSKWNQLDSNGETTGATDKAKWKWYKVSGKSWKRYGNKGKKRYLQGQYWEVNDVWYHFGADGHGIKDNALMTEMISTLENFEVGNMTLTERLALQCDNYVEDLYHLLYDQMIDYCEKLFVTDRLSYPTPTININIADLSKTTEYSGYSGLLKIKLGDTVQCINYKLGITTELRVTGVTYDVLRECNSQLQIGVTENSVVQLLDAIGKGSGDIFEDYTAGEGIVINNKVISALPQEGTIKDIIVGGQSVVYGGKATIDIDEISGEGLQWFEETEDALFGSLDQIALEKDPKFKISSGASATLVEYAFGAFSGFRTTVTIEGDSDTLMMYYTKDYATKAPYVFGSVGNSGWVLVLSKSDFNVHIHIADSRPDTPTPNVYGDYTYSTMEDGWQAGYIINPETGEHEYGWGAGCAYKGSATVDGVTWYGMIIALSNDGYAVETSSFRSLTDYLPVADYPMHDTVQGAGYYDMADLIECTVPMVRDISDHNYNGISREGNLAFFAGADDEHGTNAPIKIYRDGTYEGLDKVEDVKIGSASIVTNKIASIPVMDGATASADGYYGLVPMPRAGDNIRFLKGNGTWGNAVLDVKMGNRSILNGWGEAIINIMTGATSSTNGAVGAVPSPLSGEQGKFLRGDGTWATPSGSATAINDLTDVDITTPSDGQVLQYDNGEWVNAEPSGGTTVVANPSGTATADLTKLQVGTDIYSIPSGGGSGGVDLSLMENWDLFTNAPNYQSQTLVAGDKIKGVWTISKTSIKDDERHDATGRALILQNFFVFARDSNYNTVSLDVTVSGYSDLNTQMGIYYIATNNTNVDVAEIGYGVYFISPKAGSGGGASALEDLTDVDLTSLEDGQILKWDDSSSKWVNADESQGSSGTITQALAYKYLTPTAYGSLSSAEKSNGMIYLISDNGDGSTGFFTNYRVISPTDYENLTTAEKENGTLYLISSNSNNAMGINVVVEGEADYMSASDNLLYLLKEE